MGLPELNRRVVVGLIFLAAGIGMFLRDKQPDFPVFLLVGLALIVVGLIHQPKKPR